MEGRKTRRSDEGGSIKSKKVTAVLQIKDSASWLATQTLKQRRLTLDVQKEKDNEDTQKDKQAPDTHEKSRILSFEYQLDTFTLEIFVTFKVLALINRPKRKRLFLNDVTRIW